MTRQTVHLLEVLLADPAKEWYGLELMEATGLKSGTIYPLLHRLRAEGWLAGDRETIDPAEAGRPRRQLYRLTGAGESAARRATDHGAAARGNRAPGVLRPGGSVA